MKEPLTKVKIISPSDPEVLAFCDKLIPDSSGEVAGLYLQNKHQSPPG